MHPPSVTEPPLGSAALYCDTRGEADPKEIDCDVLAWRAVELDLVLERDDVIRNRRLRGAKRRQFGATYFAP